MGAQYNRWFTEIIPRSLNSESAFIFNTRQLFCLYENPLPSYLVHLFVFSSYHQQRLVQNTSLFYKTKCVCYGIRVRDVNFCITDICNLLKLESYRPSFKSYNEVHFRMLG